MDKYKNVYSESSHPNLSTVSEDIRFSLQPVSINIFTSCPKHCEHTKKVEVKPAQKEETPLTVCSTVYSVHCYR